MASTQAAHVLFAAVLAATIGANTARPAAADDYFKGKTIRIIAGSEAGGMYDTFGRLVSRHLADHLPGKPTVVVANMPGASGVRATNYLHEVAPKDGTVLATFNKSMPFYQAMGEGGIRFKAQEFSWIGALSQTMTLLPCGTRPASRRSRTPSGVRSSWAP